MIALVILCAVLYLGALVVIYAAAARDEADAAADAALAEQAADWDEPTRSHIEATWDDEALGRVLAALDETEETFDPMLLPLSQSPAAQRIRAQITANHEAEVARFRNELEGWGGDAA